MLRILAVLAFIGLEIGLLPLTLIGSIWYWTQLVFATRRSSVSATAYDPLVGRWLMHQAGTRTDNACERLLPHLPAVSPRVFQMMMGPTVWAMRLTGVTPPVARYPAVLPSRMITLINHRTLFFDEAVRDYLGRVEQFVILGAGWDTRAYGLPPGTAVRVFEVDSPATQVAKRAALLEAGVDAAHVTFVAVDLNSESWLEGLVREGFDPNLSTFILWEGVVYYLTEDTVRSTLDVVGARLAAGSAISFDYPSLELVHGTGSLQFRFALLYVRMKGERWRFGISSDPPARSHLSDLIAAHGLELERYEPYGLESPSERPFGGLAVAVSRY